MNDIAGRIAIVTGGSKGIGRAIAEALSAEGVHTAICSRHPAEAKEAAAAIAAPGSARVAGYVCDLRQYSQVRQFISAVVADFGGVDYLINNAGIGIMRPIEELSPDEWHAVIETNLNGVYYCCHEAIPHLKKRGGGFIINISSLAGTNAFKGGTAYNASKFGLNGFSEALMQDLRYQGIRVSTIMPGSVKTEFGNRRQSPDDDWKTHPEDIAAMVIHLLNHPARSLPSRVEMRPSMPKKS
jgi:3-oxoacyl-[acyl-carrier protein] reductase